MIRLYGAGNFVLMSDPKKEMKFVEEVKKRTQECNRLISFYFKKELETVMSVKRGIKPVLQRRNIERKFNISINNKIVGENLTQQESWDKLDEYPIGTKYEVFNPDGTLAADFIPF